MYNFMVIGFLASCLSPPLTSVVISVHIGFSFSRCMPSDLHKYKEDARIC